MRQRLIAGALIAFFVGAAGLNAQTPAGKSLDIYFIDVEGGQATLFVSPAGESLLVDSGFPGGRDSGRILETMSSIGLTQLDHLLSTHYHVDHVGGVPELAAKIPIKHFYDHGPTSEEREQFPGFQNTYADLVAKAARTSLKAGDKIPFAGVDWHVVISAMQPIKSPIAGAPGAGRANPACASFAPNNDTSSPDNGHSVGSVISYGRFRTVNLADLLWNREYDLMCPTNRIGTIDLFIVSHHGSNLSNSPALVHPLQARAAIMDNGPRKGGSPEVFATLEAAPGLEDIWQLHWSATAGLEHNAAGAFIANVEDNASAAAILTTPPTPPGGARQGGPPAARGGGGGRGNASGHVPAYLIKVSAWQDGTFTITNTRNGFAKTYRARGN